METHIREKRFGGSIQQIIILAREMSGGQKAHPKILSTFNRKKCECLQISVFCNEICKGGRENSTKPRDPQL